MTWRDDEAVGCETLVCLLGEFLDASHDWRAFWRHDLFGLLDEAC